MKRSSIHVDGFELSYIDEGHGQETIVFVHGTPSSSDEYKGLITDLKKDFRCIAFDHLGFGHSEKPVDGDYSIAAHQQRLRSAVDALGVQSFHLFVHDFGGVIGMPLALDGSGRVLSLTIANSWIWRLEKSDPNLKRQKRFMTSAFLRWLYIRFNFSARFLVPLAWGKHRPLTREKHRGYMEKFPSPKDRHGTLSFLMALFDEDDPAWQLEGRFNGFKECPVQLIWGKKDVIHPNTLMYWQTLIPIAEIHTLAYVGHFVADEAPELVAPLVRRFITKGSLPEETGKT